MSTGLEREPSVEVTEDELETLVGDRALARDDHLNAPGFVIRPDDVQDVLTDLRDEAGFDHLANLTAQQYADRYESIYHLRKYADPTQEVSIVVPTTTDEPVSQTAEPVFRTADWHEREAFDLVGIDYEATPIRAASSCPRPGRAIRSPRGMTRRSPSS